MKQKITFRLLLAVMLMAFCGGGAWAQKILLQETFDNCTGTMGWSGNAANGNFVPDNEGWSGTKMYGAGSAAKFGTGKGLGSAETPLIKTVIGAVNATLTFDAGAWSGDNKNLKLSVIGDGSLDVSSVTLKDKSWTTYTVNITGFTSSTRIKFEGHSKSNSRFLLDNVVIKEAGDPGLETQTLSFGENTDFTIVEGATFTAPTLTGAKTAVTYESRDVTVATVDASTGVVTLAGGLGTTTITASAVAGVVDGISYSEGSASYTLTVVDPNVTSVTFDFSDPAFVKSLGLVDHQKIGTFNYCGVAVEELAGGNGVKFWDGEIRHYGYSSFKITAPDDYVIVSVKFDGGSKDLSNTDDDATSTQIYTINKSNTVFVNEGKSQVRYKKVVVDLAKQTSYALTITNAGYATFSAPQAYTLPEGLKGGVVEVEGETATVTYVHGVSADDHNVAAGEALLIKGEPGKYTLNVCNEAVESWQEMNALQPVLDNNVITAAPGHKLYVFASRGGQLGFYFQKGCADGSQVSNIAFKAYLDVDKSTVPTGVNGFRLVENDVTGVENVELQSNEEKVIYTISGVRINADRNNLPKGLYIINGKKVLVK